MILGMRSKVLADDNFATLVAAHLQHINEGAEACDLLMFLSAIFCGWSFG